jgi:hypothetical protein
MASNKSDTEMEDAVAQPAPARSVPTKPAPNDISQMVPACSHRNYPFLTVQVGTDVDKFLSYCAVTGYVVFGRHNPTTNSKSSARE